MWYILGKTAKIDKNKNIRKFEDYFFIVLFSSKIYSDFVGLFFLLLFFFLI